MLTMHQLTPDLHARSIDANGMTAKDTCRCNADQLLSISSNLPDSSVNLVTSATLSPRTGTDTDSYAT